MKTHPMIQVSGRQTVVACNAMRWILTDAAVGAASGGLFGIVFGAFGLLLAAESWSMISVAGYFAVCGAAAGAIVGACRSVFECDGAANQSNRFPFSPGTSSFDVRRIGPAATAADDLTSAGDSPNRHQPRNRLFKIDRRLAREPVNPSRN